MEYLRVLVLIVMLYSAGGAPFSSRQDPTTGGGGGNPFLDPREQDEFLQLYEGMPANPTPQQRQKAIRNFQRFAGLPQTGVVDQASLAMMNKPRCGHKDPDVTGGRKKRFAAYNPVQNSADGIEYYYTHQDLSTLNMNEAEVRQAIQDAADMWNAVTSNVQISSLSSYSDLKPEDFNIYFGTNRRHNDPANGNSCPSRFGSSTLAHAYLPDSSWLSSDIHFNGQYHYDRDGSQSGFFSFLWVCVHEMGHSLGLGHSEVEGSIMWPYYSSGTVGLHQDDENGIKELYETPSPASTTTTTSGPCVCPWSRRCNLYMRWYC